MSLFLLDGPLSACGRWGSPPVPRVPGSWLCPPISGFSPAQGSRSPKVTRLVFPSRSGELVALFCSYSCTGVSGLLLWERRGRGLIFWSPSVQQRDEGLRMNMTEESKFPCPQNRERSVREQAHCMSGESGLPAGHFSSLNTPDAGLSQRRSCPGDPRSPPFFRLLGVGCVSALRQCRPCCVWRASEVAGAALVFSPRAGSPGSGPGRETPGL